MDASLVEPGDVDGLAAALAEVLRDETLAAGLGAGARQLALGTRSWGCIAQRTREMYRSLRPDVRPIELRPADRSGVPSAEERLAS